MILAWNSKKDRFDSWNNNPLRSLAMSGTYALGHMVLAIGPVWLWLFSPTFQNSKGL